MFDQSACSLTIYLFNLCIKNYFSPFCCRNADKKWNMEVVLPTCHLVNHSTHLLGSTQLVIHNLGVESILSHDYQVIIAPPSYSYCLQVFHVALLLHTGQSRW